jgi:diguanylate cyclase (GGDEF)-like protein
MNKKKNLVGEVSGAFLYGIIGAFHQINALPGSGLNLPQIDPVQWYPYSLFIETLHTIETSQPSDELMFQAGICFIKAWYNYGPGKEMIFSTLDWLRANDDSGGYNSVVRGGTKDEIGWSHLKSIDIEKGTAVYENIMPLYGKFLKGVFYGGCILFDDTEYVDVTVETQPCHQNPDFHNSTVSVYFKLKSTQKALDLEEKIDNLQLGSTLQLSEEEVQSLIWRYKGLKVSKKVHEEYSHQLNSILAKSIITIQELSITDGLTNIFNRRHFNTLFPQAINLVKRKNELLCFILIDIDYFKVYNDTYGHLMGDSALMMVASALKNHLKRADDYCFRLGGEEFGIILHTDRIDQAHTLARTILKSIEDLKIEHRGNKASAYVTASMGVVCKHGDDINDPDEMYKEADELLYKAKSNGRNRIEV